MDSVNPKHYKRLTPEPIDVIEAWGLDKDYYLATAIKYLSRCGHKGDPIEDLRKAVWFLERKIKRLENEKEKEHPTAG